MPSEPISETGPKRCDLIPLPNNTFVLVGARQSFSSGRTMLQPERLSQTRDRTTPLLLQGKSQVLIQIVRFAGTASQGMQAAVGHIQI